MILKSFFFPFGPLEVNLHLLADPATGEAILVDAGVFDVSILQFVASRDLKLATILITHLHKDHIAALPSYTAAGVGRVISPAPLDDTPDAETVRPGDSVRAAGFEFHVLKTSGHTPESITYHCPLRRLCFVGDALFAGAVGGTSNDTDHEEEIGHINRHLLTLPGDTRIYSGHGPATTIAIEKAANPFLQPGFTRLPR
jgi:hydroxyacylglutathione hydrolase